MIGAQEKKIRRIMIAAPKSGSGKTMITCGLLQIFKENGEDISSCKCGPDYIDPMFHRQVLGIPARNLDTFFTGVRTLLDWLIFRDNGIFRCLRYNIKVRHILASLLW